MNKRGAELPLSTLIVIILVVIVLIVVAVFFLGGTSKLSESIRNIFYGTTAGTDLNLAIQICNERCELAQGLPQGQQKNSAWCKSQLNIDFDQDGKLEEEGTEAGSGDETNVACQNTRIGVSCPAIDCNAK